MTLPPEEQPPEEQPPEDATAAASPPQEPPPAPPPADAPDGPPRPAERHRRLHRSRRDSWFGGVAGGLAEYFDTDPTLVRVAFVALALVSAGFAIVAYLIAWIVLPEAREGEAGRRRSGAGGTVVWGFLLILGGLALLLAQLDLDVDFAVWQVVASAVLILIGLFMAFEARRGINGGLLALALIFTAVLGVAQVVDFDTHFDGAFGDSTVRVTSVDQLEDSYSHIFGSLTVDLRDLEVPAGETVPVNVNVVFGDAELLLPEGIPARLDVEAVFGSIDGDQVEVDGIGTDRTYTPPGWEQASRRLDVTFRTVFGSGEVR